MKKVKTEVEKMVTAYCNDILENKIPHNLYVKKSVKRFLNDIKQIENEGYDYFIDYEYLQRFYDFSKTLKLSDRDEYLCLLPWQLFVFANLLGFKYKSNPEKKRFRQGALFVPRKNGKTSGIMYPLLLWDFLETPSSESYFFEKDERQSVKIFNDLKTIVKRHKDLSKVCNTSTFAITYQNSRIAYFSSESIGIDGYKPSLAVIDEYFCFPDNRCLTAMRYGSRSRLNGLTLVITTAGTDISLPAYTEYEKCEKILNGVLTDDTYFSMIFGIDTKDKWDTKEAYKKANPSIDNIINEKILNQDLQDAIATPSNRNDYKAKTLNVWSNEVSNWIPIDKWDTDKRNIKIDFNDFKNQSCYGALDLSSISDFSAYTLCFKRNDIFYFKHKFYIPQEQIQQKYTKENIGILGWLDKGYIIATPGATIDYDYIFNDIVNDADFFNIVELTYDRWNSNTLINKIDETMSNIILFPFDQSLKKMAIPTKEYEKFIYEDKIIDENPVMKWMISNAVVKPDINNNYKPMKEYLSSTKRIDGVISSIMALDRCKANEADIITKDFKDILMLF